MKNKKCYNCKKTRLIKFFNKKKASVDGLQNLCKDCSKLKSKIFYHNNKQYYQEIYLSNKETILERNKAWNKENKEKTIKHKEKFIANNPDYYKIYTNLNREKLQKQARIRAKHRRKADPIYKLKNNYRNRLYDYYRGVNRSKRSEEIIGLSWENFKLYLETKFLVGMTWTNYGEWHIDHIIPLSSARNEQELEQLFHYTNCQPLWAGDNLKKGDKLFF